MFIVHEEVLQIEGTGETEKESFQDIFSRIKPELEKKYPGILLQIEPKKMDIKDAVISVHTERFLGMLFPRKRKLYKITAEITVKLSVFLTDTIKYRHEEEKLSVVQHILEMR
ncbi:conserved hypothetical protein EF_0831/AHA_3912 [Propionispira arboris]|uniref:DUF4312 family protein n=1 Tax=Propionispira arboris TaxID=84035 RepID=A0A1H6V266_9FIRM|nr:DUF4312 family protein [Propionispira arboris]SEI98669.1 conserved hypothetical protein EF_0831/AHA_3912 [Propionispira arboris]